jgi:hypothetical protein
MPVIANLGIEEFRALVDRFDQKYVEHWDRWLANSDSGAKKVKEFGRILRSWQAFRPNVMRRPEAEAKHERPYLEQIIEDVRPYILFLQEFDLGQGRHFTNQEKEMR